MFTSGQYRPNDLSLPRIDFLESATLIDLEHWIRTSVDIDRSFWGPLIERHECGVADSLIQPVSYLIGLCLSEVRLEGRAAKQLVGLRKVFETRAVKDGDFFRHGLLQLKTSF